MQQITNISLKPHTSPLLDSSSSDLKTTLINEEKTLVACTFSATKLEYLQKLQELKKVDEEGILIPSLQKIPFQVLTSEKNKQINDIILDQPFTLKTKIGDSIFSFKFEITNREIINFIIQNAKEKFQIQSKTLKIIGSSNWWLLGFEWLESQLQQGSISLKETLSSPHLQHFKENLELLPDDFDLLLVFSEITEAQIKALQIDTTEFLYSKWKETTVPLTDDEKTEGLQSMRKKILEKDPLSKKFEYLTIDHPDFLRILFGNLPMRNREIASYNGHLLFGLFSIGNGEKQYDILIAPPNTLTHPTVQSTLEISTPLEKKLPQDVAWTVHSSESPLQVVSDKVAGINRLRKIEHYLAYFPKWLKDSLLGSLDPNPQSSQILTKDMLDFCKKTAKNDLEEEYLQNVAIQLLTKIKHFSPSEPLPGLLTLISSSFYLKDILSKEELKKIAKTMQTHWKGVASPVSTELTLWNSCDALLSEAALSIKTLSSLFPLAAFIQRHLFSFSLSEKSGSVASQEIIIGKNSLIQMMIRGKNSVVYTLTYPLKEILQTIEKFESDCKEDPFSEELFSLIESLFPTEAGFSENSSSIPSEEIDLPLLRKWIHQGLKSHSKAVFCIYYLLLMALQSIEKNQEENYLLLQLLPKVLFVIDRPSLLQKILKTLKSEISQKNNLFSEEESQKFFSSLEISCYNTSCPRQKISSYVRGALAQNDQKIHEMALNCWLEFSKKYPINEETYPIWSQLFEHFIKTQPHKALDIFKILENGYECSSNDLCCKLGSLIHATSSQGNLLRYPLMTFCADLFLRRPDLPIEKVSPIESLAREMMNKKLLKGTACVERLPNGHEILLPLYQEQIKEKLKKQQFNELLQDYSDKLAPEKLCEVYQDILKAFMEANKIQEAAELIKKGKRQFPEALFSALLKTFSEHLGKMKYGEPVYKALLEMISHLAIIQKIPSQQNAWIQWLNRIPVASISRHSEKMVILLQLTLKETLEFPSQLFSLAKEILKTSLKKDLLQALSPSQVKSLTMLFIAQKQFSEGVQFLSDFKKNSLSIPLYELEEVFFLLLENEKEIPLETFFCYLETFKKELLVEKTEPHSIQQWCQKLYETGQYEKISLVLEKALQLQLSLPSLALIKETALQFLTYSDFTEFERVLPLFKKASWIPSPEWTLLLTAVENEIKYRTSTITTDSLSSLDVVLKISEQDPSALSYFQPQMKEIAWGLCSIDQKLSFSSLKKIIQFMIRFEISSGDLWKVVFTLLMKLEDRASKEYLVTLFQETLLGRGWLKNETAATVAFFWKDVFACWRSLQSPELLTYFYDFSLIESLFKEPETKQWQPEIYRDIFIGAASFVDSHNETLATALIKKREEVKDIFNSSDSSSFYPEISIAIAESLFRIPKAPFWEESFKIASEYFPDLPSGQITPSKLLTQPIDGSSYLYWFRKILFRKIFYPSPQQMSEEQYAQIHRLKSLISLLIENSPEISSINIQLAKLIQMGLYAHTPSLFKMIPKLLKENQSSKSNAEISQHILDILTLYLFQASGKKSSNTITKTIQESLKEFSRSLLKEEGQIKDQWIGCLASPYTSELISEKEHQCQILQVLMENTSKIYLLEEIKSILQLFLEHWHENDFETSFDHLLGGALKLIMNISIKHPHALDIGGQFYENIYLTILPLNDMKSNEPKGSKKKTQKYSQDLSKLIGSRPFYLFRFINTLLDLIEGKNTQDAFSKEDKKIEGIETPESPAPLSPSALLSTYKQITDHTQSLSTLIPLYPEFTLPITTLFIRLCEKFLALTLQHNKSHDEIYSQALQSVAHASRYFKNAFSIKERRERMATLPPDKSLYLVILLDQLLETITPETPAQEVILIQTITMNLFPFLILFKENHPLLLDTIISGSSSTILSTTEARSVNMTTDQYFIKCIVHYAIVGDMLSDGEQVLDLYLLTIPWITQLYEKLEQFSGDLDILLKAVGELTENQIENGLKKLILRFSKYPSKDNWNYLVKCLFDAFGTINLKKEMQTLFLEYTRQVCYQALFNEFNGTTESLENQKFFKTLIQLFLTNPDPLISDFSVWVFELHVLTRPFLGDAPHVKDSSVGIFDLMAQMVSNHDKKKALIRVFDQFSQTPNKKNWFFLKNRLSKIGLDLWPAEHVMKWILATCYWIGTQPMQDQKNWEDMTAFVQEVLHFVTEHKDIANNAAITFEIQILLTPWLKYLTECKTPYRNIHQTVRGIRQIVVEMPSLIATTSHLSDKEKTQILLKIMNRLLENPLQAHWWQFIEAATVFNSPFSCIEEVVFSLCYRLILSEEFKIQDISTRKTLVLELIRLYLNDENSIASIQKRLELNFLTSPWFFDNEAYSQMILHLTKEGSSLKYSDLINILKTMIKNYELQPSEEGWHHLMSCFQMIPSIFQESPPFLEIQHQMHALSKSIPLPKGSQKTSNFIRELSKLNRFKETFESIYVFGSGIHKWIPSQRQTFFKDFADVYASFCDLLMSMEDCSPKTYEEKAKLFHLLALCTNIEESILLKECFATFDLGPYTSLLAAYQFLVLEYLMACAASKFSSENSQTKSLLRQIDEIPFPAETNEKEAKALYTANLIFYLLRKETSAAFQTAQSLLKMSISLNFFEPDPGIEPNSSLITMKNTLKQKLS